MLAIRALFCFCLCTLSSLVSEALMLALRTLSCSSLCTVCSRASLDLCFAFRILSFSFRITITFSHIPAHKVFILGSPTAQQLAFLFDEKAWPQSHTALFTCNHFLQIGHVFLRRIPDLTDSIATRDTRQQVSE